MVQMGDAVESKGGLDYLRCLKEEKNKRGRFVTRKIQDIFLRYSIIHPSAWIMIHLDCNRNDLTVKSTTKCPICVTALKSRNYLVDMFPQVLVASVVRRKRLIVLSRNEEVSLERKVACIVSIGEALKPRFSWNIKIVGHTFINLFRSHSFCHLNQSPIIGQLQKDSNQF